MLDVWERRRDLVERWWNGKYGRLARKEVRVYHEVAERWTVEVAAGELDDARVKAVQFADERSAREYATHCRDAVPDNWKSLNG